MLCSERGTKHLRYKTRTIDVVLGLSYDLLDNLISKFFSKTTNHPLLAAFLSGCQFFFVDGIWHNINGGDAAKIVCARTGFGWEDGVNKPSSSRCDESREVG